MNRIKLMLTCAALFFITANIYAQQNVAIFPPLGVNTDKSFEQAFGALFSMKYQDVSGKTVITPRNSAKAFYDADTIPKAAANTLGASEYIVIEAVGLYLSRNEAKEFKTVQTENGVVVQLVAVDGSNGTTDQELLDNSKTIVTVTRFSAFGEEIYRTKMTLLTYGDIEESTERMAISLFKKIPVEQTVTSTTVTRREGMGNNKMFSEKISGVKIAGQFPFSSKGPYNQAVLIGYNMKMESEKFFLEFGAAAFIPSGLFEDNAYSYGGPVFEIGVSGIPIGRENFPLFVGGGISPFLNFNGDFEMGLSPYAQVGFLSPRKFKSRFFAALRISQSVFPITVLSVYEPGTYENGYDSGYKRTTDYPTEIGVQFGIGW